jgi:hypothetical protein
VAQTTVFAGETDQRIVRVDVERCAQMHGRRTIGFAFLVHRDQRSALDLAVLRHQTQQFDPAGKR